MSHLAIRAENLCKRYRIGLKEEKHDTLVRAALSWLKSPAINFRRLRKLSSFDDAEDSDDVIWALKDVSMEVKQGEVVGIIGRNGAGKSTLLKVLSQITELTSGRAVLAGRAASLLEVGTGFHPELTGRENVYLNGTILGMTKREVDRKFDEIVAFAEVEKFIDTPVKFYSSGMNVRLAFAVAAHLEPEILLIDEVLAVGDAAFQKKSLGKMNEVATQGRTVLFVSHNMTAINRLCPRTIHLNEGRIMEDGPTQRVVANYLSAAGESAGERIWTTPAGAPGNDRVRLHAVRILSEGAVRSTVDIDKEVVVEVAFWNLIPGSRLFTDLFLLDSMGNIVLETANMPGANKGVDEWFCKSLPVGLFRTRCTLPANFLNDGRYYINVIVATCSPPRAEVKAMEVISFEVFDTGAMRTPGFSGRWNGVVRVPLAWKTEMLAEQVGVLSEVSFIRNSLDDRDLNVQRAT